MTRLNKRLSATLAVLAALSVPTFLTTAHAGGPSTQLLAATLDGNRSSISGTFLATFTVSLHLHDDNGISPTVGASNGDESINCPCAKLDTVDSNGKSTAAAHLSRAINERFVALHRTSGTAQDGWWTGTTTVGAAGFGHWQLTGVNAGTLVGGTDANNGSPGFATIDGAGYGAVFDLAGKHWPVLTIAEPAHPVTYGLAYIVRGTARYSDTKAPIADLKLAIAQGDPFQWPLSPGLHHVTTDSNGRWSIRLSALTFGTGVLFGVNDIPGADNRVDKQYTTEAIDPRLPLRWKVQLTLQRSGSRRTFTASLAPNSQGPTTVRFERRTSSGWSVVSSRTTNQNMRASFVTSTSGTYRVVALAGGGLAAAGSDLIST